MAKLVIDANRKLSKINKEIQGQFSEHLGRCIYEGLYVGENSDIPNVNGMRTDVVEALKNIKVPVLRWPGGCFADEFHWNRKKCCVFMAVVMIVLGSASSMGYGALDFIQIFGMAFLDFFDFISNSVLMPIAAFLTCLFVGYIIKPKVIVDEVESSGKFKRKSLFLIMVKYIAPICIVAILVFSVLEGLGFITV